MPTRKPSSKKSGKKSAAKKDASASLSMASYVPLGPPFAGSGPFYGSWGRYPGSNRPATCPGFWAAVAFTPTCGGIVSQLGANAGTGPAFCISSVHYRFDFTAPVTGVHAFLLVLNLGYVTLLSRGGSVYTNGVLKLEGPGGPWAMYTPNANLAPWTGASVVIYPYLQGGARYSLSAGVVTQIYNAGYQSYAEIIVNSATLSAYLPYGVQSAQALSPDAGIEREALTALLSTSEKQVARKTSMAEAIKMGTTEG